MKQYLDLVKNILSNGKWKENRTGINTKSITGSMFEHNMADGFPLLTTKKMGLKNIAVELEFFIKGLSDKRWLQERNCHIWDGWANPEKVPYSNDPSTLKKMEEENDLGRIYGVQWRNWQGYEEVGPGQVEPYNIDQLANIIDTLKTNPLDRRMICMAWNPAEIGQQALPPCHYSFQIISDGESVDLLWNQRSVDVPLGLPYNIASYALLLELIAKTVNMKAGKLIGFLADCHIYENQTAIQTQVDREPGELPTLILSNETKTGEKLDIFNWEFDDFELTNYNPAKGIKMPIAV